MEAVELPEFVDKQLEKPWAVTGETSTRHNLITSVLLKHEVLEAHNIAINEKYRVAAERECLWQEYASEDADVLLVSYGITSRVALAATELARESGIAAGLFRPISLYPFPSQRLNELGIPAGIGTIWRQVRRQAPNRLTRVGFEVTGFLSSL